MSLQSTRSRLLVILGLTLLFVSPLLVIRPNVEANDEPQSTAIQLKNDRLASVQAGQYPAQLEGSTGSVAPNRYGPNHNDPAAGIPDHAYSPFDAHVNADHPCPPGGCEFEQTHVLIKLRDDISADPAARSGAWTSSPSLNGALQEAAVQSLAPVFPTASAPRAAEMIESPDGQLRPMPDLTRWQRVGLSRSAKDVYAIVEQLSTHPDIEYAEPDYLRRMAPLSTSQPSTPSIFAAPPPDGSGDPLFAQQWHLNAANIPAAWQHLESNGLEPGGSRDIVIAVIDSGVDYTHPDLAANMWVNSTEFNGTPGNDDDGNGFVDDIHGVNVVSNSWSENGDPADDHGHGTHVAGIIAAQANNNVGGVGVAYNSQIMAIKAAQYSGVLSSSDIAQAIYYAVEQGADVINMSFGGYTRSQLEEDALAIAFGQAVLVAAAGNDGKINSPCTSGRDMYPAAYSWVLGVMAQRQHPSINGDYLAGFSNYDCQPQDSHEYELMAPGVDVWSTLPNGLYSAWDGTSMATPVVSGIAALLRTKFNAKDIYSSRFIMGQLATTGQKMQAYTPSTGLPVYYYIPDAVSGLSTFPNPKLSYLEHWAFDTITQSSFNDDDGIVDSGETIDLAIVIRNHWGKADPVTVTLEARAEGAFQPDPYITMITDTVSYGAVGSFNIDDNGFIYEDDVITGVQHPFRFYVDPNTPNDHIITFRLTMTASNGYDLDAPPLTFESRLYLLVQRGVELPRIIGEDMTLTKDNYYIIPHQTLIEEGIVVTVTEGTQVQFHSGDPADPYSEDATAFLQIEGKLIVTGTTTNPVSFFPSPILVNRGVELTCVNQGIIDANHLQLLNPYIFCSDNGDFRHSYFTSDEFEHILVFDSADWVGTMSATPQLFARTISHSILDSLGIGSYDFWVRGTRTANLFESSALIIDNHGGSTNGGTILTGNVFLKNYRLYGQQFGDRTYWGSKASGIGFSCSGCDLAYGIANNTSTNNAFLNVWWDPDISHWMRIYSESDRDRWYYLTGNWWGTSNNTLIDAAIHDYNDNFNYGRIIYEPKLNTPPETAYPFVTDVVLSMADVADATVVGAESVTFTVSFNRDMNTTVSPAVSFGPDVPQTDYTIHPINGGWSDARTWHGTFNITPATGDGYQFIRVAGAVAADDAWLVTGDDSERFRFEIITSGTEAMMLQATGGEGFVNLSWMQDDFDMLAGFNLYRSETEDGNYTRINNGLISAQQLSYTDTDVQPGQPYFYKFTIIKTDMAETNPSNIAEATPVDTILPIINHSPLTQAVPQMPLTISADITDNVQVTGATLFYRPIGTTIYTSRAMTHTSSNRFTATLSGSNVTPPGIEYYIEATDGISIARSGRPEDPHQIDVPDQPVVTSVTPNVGSASGGTAVTIAGSNFDSGATVTFDGVLCDDITVVNANQITCTPAAHFPATVDVTVTNSASASNTLLNGFTYQSDTAFVSLPNTGGEQYALVEVPINVSDLNGLAAASMTLSYDDAVLQAVSARSGGVAAGWTVTTNTNVTGEVRLSMASSGGLASGSGVLAYITFDVLGAPDSISGLTLTSADFNDGAIPTDIAHGSFAVDRVYAVSGNVAFWNGGTVPNVELLLSGDRAYNNLSDASGNFAVSGARNGSYTLTASKSDDADGITAFDASLIMRHDVGLSTLTGWQATLGDVNQSGSINAFDAYLVLQHSADLLPVPFSGAGVVWTFSPTSRSIPSLTSDVTNQNFNAGLIGDVSGSWSTDGSTRSTTNATLTLPVISVDPATEISVPLSLANVTGDVWSVDLSLTYDPSVVTLQEIRTTSQTENWTMVSNLTQAGIAHVALAGANGLLQDGQILSLEFAVDSAAGNMSTLDMTRADVNEQAASTQDGYIYVGGIPLSVGYVHGNIGTHVAGSVLAWLALFGLSLGLLYRRRHLG